MKKQNSSIDKKWANELKSGDEKAFRKIYDHYFLDLFNVCLKRVSGKEDAEDIVYELFMELWNNREKIQIEKSLSAYLFTALKYKIIHFYKNRRLKEDYLQHNSMTGGEVTTENNHSYNEVEDLIRTSIEGLPEKCKIVFKLSRYEDYSIKEIADLLKISPFTAQNHIKKAIKLLKFQLKEYTPLSL